MINIGIDIGKFDHHAIGVDHNGEVPLPHFKFSNTLQGFKELCQSLQPYLESDHLIGLEDTGHYGETLFSSC